MTDYAVGQFDTGLPGANWDSDLQWDITVGPSPGDSSRWLALITSEHNQRPKFMHALAALLQPVADNVVNLDTLQTLFDLDNAVGSQLDLVGQWIGLTRHLSVPLSGVYFSFDSPTLGFDQGSWYAPFNPIGELAILDDDSYRALLRARVARNQWDGSTDGAYAIWNRIFEGTGVGILIQDFGDMHILLALTGPVPDAVMTALFKSGALSFKPAGVKIDGYFVPTVPNTPYFAFDIQSDGAAGFDTGAWGISA